LSARFIVLAVSFLVASCTDSTTPSSSPYFAEVTPPAKRELRWSNGKLPRSFDPALAAAPPEADIVRAIYEGLTTVDPKTFDALPAVAERWLSPDGGRTWTFQLRNDARWSNGKVITGDDFVRSWERLNVLGERAAHPELLRNFARQKSSINENEKRHLGNEMPSVSPKPLSSPYANAGDLQTRPLDETANVSSSPTTTQSSQMKPVEPLALKVIGPNVLMVALEKPDPDFPKLVADPVFLPVYGDGSEFAQSTPEQTIISNGAFKLTSAGKGGVVLSRSETYRDAAETAVDMIQFVPADNADDALEAYRSGKVDVVSNTEFEPLALKLLAPYQDFRKATHGAVNLYEFNRTRAPFSDRRVREALAISIERERLTEGEMEGATRPAFRFLPFGGQSTPELTQDVSRAKALLDAAGYPNGENFPTVRLVVNRNDTQQRIARAVSRMWKQNLGINAEIIVRETAEMAAVRQAGDFDVIRRGIVFPTSDTNSNLELLFSGSGQRTSASPKKQPSPGPGADADLDSDEPPGLIGEPRGIPTEAEALYQFSAIPLYFPASYILVKPYVQGFEPNGLDIILAKDIDIDNNWQPRNP